MEKRIFLAILISLGLLWGWAVLAPRLFPELVKRPQATKPVSQTPATATNTAATGTTATTASVTTTDPAAPAVVSTPAPASAARIAAGHVQLTVVDTPEYKAVFSNRGAQLISFQLKHYLRKKQKQQPEDLVKAREASRTDYPFTIVPADRALLGLNSGLYTVSDVVEANGQRVLEYRYSDGRVTAKKTFRFPKQQPYLFNFSVEVNPPSPYRVEIGPGIRTLSPEELDTKVVTTGNGIYQAEGKLKIVPREKAPRLQVLPAVDYIGIEDNYFLTSFRPQRAGEGILQRVTFFNAKTKTHREDVYAGLNAANGLVAGEAFFGPKETKLLDRYGMGEALQFGWFSMIARFFLTALIWLHQFTHNYGFAIIVLTILIKIVLYPLQHKSIVSMKKMQKVQPKVEAIKQKYKKSKTDADQRQKMNVEMMALYQKEGINPMAGCLPLVLQLPILWGFYNLLSRAIELRGAPWILWIHDLSDKDPTYVLPVLMTATMFLQTYITPSTGDPAQRKIFLIMPLVFGFLFKDFPSGLVLYWLVQNILTITQQAIMNKWWKDHPAEIQKA